MLIFSALAEIIYLAASRILISYVIELNTRKENEEKTEVFKKTLIIGAGSAGQVLFNEILHNNEKGFEVVGFVDDDKEMNNVFKRNIDVFPYTG